MKKKTTFAALAILVSLLLTVVALRQPRQVKAQEISPSAPDRVSFGLIAIASGQTLRVSVANTIMPNDANLPPGPTRVSMTFRYMNGNLVRDYKTGEVIRRVVDLERGDSTVVDVDYDRLPPGPVRVQIRAVVNVQPPPITEPGQNAIPYDSAVPSIEVINNANGRTQFAVFTHPAVARGFNPQPDPPKGE